MKRDDLLKILSEVERGGMSPAAAAERLASLPFEDLGHARVDHHRSLRSGLPEVIYAAGKTQEQTLAIFGSLLADGVDVLVTRVEPVTADALVSAYPGAVHHATGADGEPAADAGVGGSPRGTLRWCVRGRAICRWRKRLRLRRRRLVRG